MKSLSLHKATVCKDHLSSVHLCPKGVCRTPACRIPEKNRPDNLPGLFFYLLRIHTRRISFSQVDSGNRLKSPTEEPVSVIALSVRAVCGLFNNDPRAVQVQHLGENIRGTSICIAL